MLRATVVCAAVVLCAGSLVRAQEPARSDGWVVIPVDDYRALRLKAFPPERPAAPPPVDAALTRVEYDLRVNGESAAGETRLTVDVLKEGWVRVDIPPGLLVRSARLDGRALPLIDQPVPHVLLSKIGRAVLSLDVAVPLKVAGGSEALTLPPSAGAVTRLALVVPRQGIDVAVSGGVLADRPQSEQAPWVAFGRSGQPLTVTWTKRTEDARATQPLRWRGSVTQIAALGEDASPVTATVRVEITQGLASSIDVAIPDGLTVNQVSGALVAEWDVRPGTLRIGFLEPVPAQTSFAISGEARVPRDGAIAIPLVRLPAAERETGGVGVDVLGAGEIGAREPRGLDPADPSDLGDSLAGRDSPSMVAFRFRPQAGSAPRSLSVNVVRYTPQAVLVANVEEARYDALLAEEGKTLVRARYAVRNNQRAFLALTLPPGATLWTAAVAGRLLRPGISPSGALLLPLEKGRAGGDTPAFAVEITYVQRVGAWDEKGRAALVLPAMDLPIARTGIVVHHSPRYRVTAEPGPFRLETDTGPFTDALRGEPASPLLPAAPAGVASGSPSPTDERVVQFSKDAGGRTITGPLPVRIPFPHFGPSVFLTSELTAELQAPSLELSYKRESRW
jgi:hypothetical protein